MLSGIIAFVFGIFEAVVLRELLTSATSGNYKKLAVCLTVKFITYAIAITSLVLFFSQYILNCVIGYSIGLPVITVIWFIYSTVHGRNAESGDDLNENNNNN